MTDVQTTQDIWTPTPQRDRLGFGQCEILVESQASEKGGYTKITLNIFPVSGSANTNMQTGTYFKFANHTKPWDSHVLPVIRDLMKAGKIKNAPDIDGRWISWKWGQWRTYRANDIQYWRDRAENEKAMGQDEDAVKSLAKIQTDEKGKEYVEKGYIHILDVFASEDECQKAHDDYYGIEANGVVPGFEDEPQAPETHADDSTIAAFLANFIVMAMQNGKVNETTFKGFFDANELFVKQFATVENSVVRRAIEKANGGTIDPNELGKFIVEEMKLPF